MFIEGRPFLTWEGSPSGPRRLLDQDRSVRQIWIRLTMLRKGTSFVTQVSTHDLDSIKLVRLCVLRIEMRFVYFCLCKSRSPR